mgnify:CR=1 FL=1
MAKQRVKDWLKQENLMKVQGWARDGKTEEQIAELMGISKRTLYNWKKKEMPLLQALKVGKDVADRQVENALFKSALGYDYEEDTVTNDGRVVKVKKHKPANTTAQIFWLKNRKPEQWRDKREFTHDGEISNNINLQNITDEDLHELAKLDKLNKEV